MAHLSLSLLGPFQATLDDQPITSFESAKVRALLIYLAVEADRPHAREALAGLLWPNWPDRAALRNLSYALSDLRQAIGDRRAQPPFLLIMRNTIQFNTASDYTSDLERFRQTLGTPSLRSLAVDSLRQAVNLYRSRFLDGFSCDSDAFEEWVLFEREQLEQQAFSALRCLTEHYERHGDYPHAAACARRQLELEPWDEEANQQAMRALAFSGQRSAALAQYESCRRLLMQELGIAPSPETTSLYESIRDGVFERVRLPAFLLEPATEETRPGFVARDHELAQLDGWLASALSSQGQAVFVAGDSGSGKTALVQEFVRRAMEAHDELIVVHGNGNAYSGIGDPYLPFVQVLQMLTGDVEAQWASGAVTRELACRLWNLLPDTARALMEVGPDLIGRLIPASALAARAQARALGALWLARLDALIERQAAAPVQQMNLFEQYTRVLQAVARLHPLVIVLDDLQWADAGSLSLLFHLGRQLAGSRILVVGAYRPDDVAVGRDGQRHPLEPVVHEFQGAWGNICLDLAQSQGQALTEALLDMEPNRLGTTFRQALYQHTAGHPLFTIELLRGLHEHGDLAQDDAGQWVEGPTLNWDRLPARVEAVIAERIGRLPERWQALLAAASVEGEQFTAEVTARVQQADEQELIQHLSGALTRQYRLVGATSCERLGDRRLSRYRFQHYLFQKYLYNSLDPVRRARLHQSVGEALEELYRDRADEIAPALAWHFESAELADKAVSWLQRAGERATRVSANAEAIGHLSRAVELLQTLPESSERDQRELELQLALGAPLQALKGYGAPQVGRAYDRARELCRQMSKTPQLFMARDGLESFYGIRADFRTARELAEQNVALAQRIEDPLLTSMARWQMGWLLTAVGEFVQAREQLEPVIAFYDLQQHRSLAYTHGQDMGVSCMAWLSWNLQFLGYPDQALRQSQAAIALAQQLDHPFTLAFALGIAGSRLHHFRREDQAAEELTDAAMQLATKAGFVFYQTMNALGQAIAWITAGQIEEGLTQARQCLARSRAVGTEMTRSCFLGRLAEACGKVGRNEEGLEILAEALAFVQTSDERFYEAELYRVKGDLLRTQGESEAEACYRQAIEVARGQQAQSWELRATMSLCRLWQKQGKQQEACQTLAQVYHWFAEGFSTPDLQGAKVLLEELA